jgi:uncharacterized membrane protein
VKTTLASKLRLLLWEESGQVLPVSVLMFTALLGVAGLTIDLGHVFYCERTLQEVANAAALAGAGSMRTASTGADVLANATSFSAVAGSVNARGALPNVTMVSGYPALKCLAALQSQGMACLGTIPYNAVQVKEQAVVPAYFAGLFGFHNFTITRTATAASRGASASSYNVAVIVIPHSRWRIRTPIAVARRSSAR